MMMKRNELESVVHVATPSDSRAPPVGPAAVRVSPPPSSQQPLMANVVIAGDLRAASNRLQVCFSLNKFYNYFLLIFCFD